MLNINKHRNILLQILRNITDDTEISPILGFKGGTAAMLFYKLDRFSVDLDFDLLDESKEDIVFNKIGKIVERYGEIKLAKKKRFNLIFVVSYEKNMQSIKVEINRRNYGSRYELKSHMGISVLVMKQEDMFANKMMAMYERIGKTSRDIYDVWYFAKQNWSINKELIEKRSGKSFDEIIKSNIQNLTKIKDKDMLKGLGELLTQSQKDWVKSKLKQETIFLLNLMLK
jgi:predicted nucleotidyltransferase component of viral defense system